MSLNGTGQKLQNRRNCILFMYKAKAKARPRQMTSKTSPFGAPFKRGSAKPKGREPLGEKKYT